MRKKWNKIMVVCIAGTLLAVQVTGCGKKAETPVAESAKVTAVAAEKKEKTGQTSEDIQVTAKLGEDGEKTITYLAADLDDTWDESTAVDIAFATSVITVNGTGADVSGQTVTITKAGTYVVSGTLADGRILIDAGKEGVVQLVLNGVKLSNQTTAPIYSSGKTKVILTLAAGTTNTVSDSNEYVFADATDDEPDAPIFTKGDLIINGTGSLDVYGNYGCAIRSKSVLTVISGDLNLNAESDGLKGKDAVIIRAGNINIASGKDGIKSNNDEDIEKGYIWIDGGQIQIAAQDDGIQAENALIINGGDITITESQEALAGKTVDIIGGFIKAVAGDDGINSAATVVTEMEKQQDQEGVYTRIAGGEIWLNAKADGIDSNGDIYIEGGTIYLSGPTGNMDGILDYNGKGYISGGTFFGAGSSGMMQTFEADSTQNYLVVYYTATEKAGTKITLTDDNGNEMGSYAPEKDFTAVIISSPEIRTGNTYHVITAEETVDLPVNGIMTAYGTASGGMGDRGGAADGGQRPGQGQMPTNEAGETINGRPGGGQMPQNGEISADGTGGGRGMGGPNGGQRPQDGEMPTGEMPPDGQPPEMPTTVAGTSAQ